MSKIFAISSTGKTGKSFLDLRFGKCENVVLYNQSEKSYLIIENPFKNSDQSGVKLIRFLQNEGVSTIITGEVGPTVGKLLEKEKLQLVMRRRLKLTK